METKRLIFIFLGMWAVTYFPRLIPLAALSQVRLPRVVMTWLSYLPAAILSALILPGAITADGAIDAGLANPNVMALLASFIIAVRTKSLVLTMVIGSLTVFVGQVVLG